MRGWVEGLNQIHHLHDFSVFSPVPGSPLLQREIHSNNSVIYIEFWECTGGRVRPAVVTDTGHPTGAV
jgi:hypothetical protein